MSEGYLKPSGEGVLLSLRVSPGAKRSQIEGSYGGNALRIRVAAPPVDGKANAEVERYLAELLKISRSDVTVVRGASGRDKVVLIRRGDVAGLRRLLARRLSA